MRSPQTTGVEFPRSGRGTRQMTFSFSLHFSGGVFSVETPIPEGPRQAGQSSHFANGGKDDARIASATTQKPLQFNMFILSFSQSPSGGFNQIMSTDGKPSRFHLPLVLRRLLTHPSPVRLSHEEPRSGGRS